ncbi:MAG: hypothetical protein P1U38_09660 [Aeromicrobium sp.]|uniref:hypothetical protein n=1 Tax=Aeromicrobium sp. TaxID=1871063 RepID=UPI002611C154|nr:hypothetical protein [Aeromicrobium sp.]MDF1705027.1 hypothetical protein [Aeromicrobium sp.]
MSRGGARNRSGPGKDEASARSEQAGYSLTALPAEGFAGQVPDFPLSARRIYRWEFEDKRKFQVFDEESTEAITDREAELWSWLWTTPQACAWSMPSERWRLHTIAMYVRTFVICEGDEATAADKGAVHRFGDQIGMTPAGLRENGWKIAVDELSARRSGKPDDAAPEDGVYEPRLRDAE